MKRESFSASDSSVRNILELMRAFAEVHARAMFGGHGLYRDGLMFALLADGVLYLKVDEQSRPVFTERDLRAFSFMAKGRAVQLSYHEAPPEALEDKGEMAHWCRLAWQSALRVRAAGGKGTTGSARGSKRASDTALRPRRGGSVEHPVERAAKPGAEQPGFACRSGHHQPGGAARSGRCKGLRAGSCPQPSRESEPAVGH